MQRSTIVMNLVLLVGLSLATLSAAVPVAREAGSLLLRAPSLANLF